MTKILAFADMHFGAGADYGREPGDRLEDQVKVGQRIVEIARERGCDLILNAGDSFEGPTVQPEHYSACQEAFVDAPEPILSILGNGRHDAAKRVVTAPAISAVLDIVTRPCVMETPGVAVACLPWCPVDRYVASQIGGERAAINRQMTAALISVAQGLRAECREKYPDLPCVLLAHWSIEGGVTATGVETISFAEPVLPLADLEAMEWDLIAGGHIHKPMLLSPPGYGPLPLAAAFVDDRPIVQLGSPVQLNFGEEGDHGVWIVTLGEGPVQVEFVPIESREFVTLDADWLTPETGDPIPKWDTDGIAGAIVRVRYTATAEQARRIDHRKLRDALYAAGAHKVWEIEATVERVTRARVEGIDESLGELDSLGLYLKAQGIKGATALAMRERTAKYLEEVRA